MATNPGRHYDWLVLDDLVNNERRDVMATNRTKIDWAYRQAERLMSQGVFNTPSDRIRAIAALLRRAEKRGLRQAPLC
jgi:hypothetical protein